MLYVARFQFSSLPLFSRDALQGATLLEVLISLMILSVSILGYAGATFQGIELTQSVHQRETALQIVNELRSRMHASGNLSAYYLAFSTQSNRPNVGSLGASKSCVKSAGKNHHLCTLEDRARRDILEMSLRADDALTDAELSLQACGSANINIYCIVLTWHKTPANACFKDLDFKASGEKALVYSAGPHCVYMPFWLSAG